MLVKYGPEAVLSDIVVIPTEIGYAPCRVLTTNYIFGAGEDPVGYEIIVEPIEIKRSSLGRHSFFGNMRDASQDTRRK